MFNEILTLSNGVKILQLALGTWLDGERLKADISEDDIRSWISGFKEVS